jgi:N-methylhydantoinase A
MGERMAYHVGIDVGGTFTDLFALDDISGRAIAEKAETTADAVGGLMSVLDKAAIPPGDIASLVFGSTLATNMLVEGKGAPVAFLGTAGFTDSLEVRRLWREHLFGWRWERPRALVPHALRLPIGGRIGPGGEELAALDEASIDAAVERMRARGVACAAVCLLFAFRNPDHERRVRERIEAIAPEIRVLLSHEINPEIGEYERASTTVIAAVMSPGIEIMLGTLEARLAAAGVRAPVRVIKSNGGITSVATARKKPLEMMRSGPAGGVASALSLARTLERPNLIGVDMGGTTADVCVITRGEIAVVQRVELAWDIPVRATLADVRSVGAGGGSIAAIDPAGRLQVGPRSAGSAPGPVCYGRGGSAPTVTDAMVTAGLVDAGRFLGGRMALDAGAARAAIEEAIAAPLGLGVEAASAGIVRLVGARMAQLIGEMTVQAGLDPRDYSLVGFGGGGPVFAALLADEIEAAEAIVPCYPAVWSAFGGLFADIVHDYARSVVADAASLDLDALSADASALAEEARADLVRDGVKPGAGKFDYALDMRYAGQSHELTIPLAEPPPFSKEAVTEAGRAFERRHEAAFAHRRPGDEREVIALRLRVRVANGLAPPAATLSATFDAGGERRRRAVWFPDGSGPVETAVLDRAALPAEFEVIAPAVIEEDQSTTLVPEGFRLRVASRGELIMTRGAS